MCPIIILLTWLWMKLHSNESGPGETMSQRQTSIEFSDYVSNISFIFDVWKTFYIPSLQWYFDFWFVLSYLMYFDFWFVLLICTMYITNSCTIKLFMMPNIFFLQWYFYFWFVLLYLMYFDFWFVLLICTMYMTNSCTIKLFMVPNIFFSHILQETQEIITHIIGIYDDGRKFSS